MGVAAKTVPQHPSSIMLWLSSRRQRRVVFFAPQKISTLPLTALDIRHI